MYEKPEYARAKAHLDNPQDTSLWPRDAKEQKAVEVVKSQRRYTESKRRQAERNRSKT